MKLYNQQHSCECNYQCSRQCIRSKHLNNYRYILNNYQNMYQCKTQNKCMSNHNHIRLFLVAWHLR